MIEYAPGRGARPREGPAGGGGKARTARADFAADRAVIAAAAAAAERRFPEGLVLRAADPVLVLANRPLGAGP